MFGSALVTAIFLASPAVGVSPSGSASIHAPGVEGWRLDHDARGRVTRIVDPNGTSTVLTYDQGLLRRIDVSDGTTTKLRYSERGPNGSFGVIESLTNTDDGRQTYLRRVLGTGDPSRQITLGDATWSDAPQLEGLQFAAAAGPSSRELAVETWTPWVVSETGRAQVPLVTMVQRDFSGQVRTHTTVFQYDDVGNLTHVENEDGTPRFDGTTRDKPWATTFSDRNGDQWTALHDDVGLQALRGPDGKEYWRRGEISDPDRSSSWSRSCDDDDGTATPVTNLLETLHEVGPGTDPPLFVHDGSEIREIQLHSNGVPIAKLPLGPHGSTGQFFREQYDQIKDAMHSYNGWVEGIGERAGEHFIGLFGPNWYGQSWATAASTIIQFWGGALAMGPNLILLPEALLGVSEQMGYGAEFSEGIRTRDPERIAMGVAHMGGAIGTTFTAMALAGSVIRGGGNAIDFDPVFDSALQNAAKSYAAESAGRPLPVVPVVPAAPPTLSATPLRRITTTAGQLQKKFNHAGELGVKGNYNKAKAAEFKAALERHVAGENVLRIEGTYRGDPAVHYVDPTTGIDVMTHPTGEFWSVWRLNTEQYANVMTRGSL